MNGFRVREARLADRFEIAVLWCELMQYHQELDGRFRIAPDGEQKYARHAQEIMRSRNGRVLVAEAEPDGALVGFLLGEVQIRPPKSLPGIYGFISDVYVRAEWRQHGVGSALFDDMRQWFQTRKANAIELYVSEYNPTALAFWQTLGMTPFLKLVHLDL